LRAFSPGAENALDAALKWFTLNLARPVELAAASVTGVASVEALWRYARTAGRSDPRRPKEAIRPSLGRSLALEFELGADILKAAVAPTWNDIGLLAPRRRAGARRGDERGGERARPVARPGRRPRCGRARRDPCGRAVLALRLAAPLPPSAACSLAFDDGSLIEAGAAGSALAEAGARRELFGRRREPAAPARPAAKARGPRRAVERFGKNRKVGRRDGAGRYLDDRRGRNAPARDGPRPAVRSRPRALDAVARPRGGGGRARPGPGGRPFQRTGVLP
jgi:hypothetical protein